MATPPEELQKAVYDALRNDADVSALVGDRIYDAVPDEPVFPYVSFGSSQIDDDPSTCIDGPIETLQIDVWSRDNARLRLCKALTWHVRDALNRQLLQMEIHALSSADVTFCQIVPDPDGLTAHGIVQLTALMEAR